MTTSAQEPDKSVETPHEVSEASVKLSRELAQREYSIGRTVTVTGYRGVLIAACVLWVLQMLTPHIQGVGGWQVVLITDASREANIKITEFIFVIMTSLGAGILNVIYLITKRFSVIYAAWVCSGIGMFFSLLALWIRQTRPESEASGSANVGMYLGVAAVILAVIGLSSIVLRRSPEQQEIANQRAATPNVDAVGLAQRSAFSGTQETSWENNPLFVDDRRQQASRRHTGR